jgi:hypothetical protein
MIFAKDHAGHGQMKRTDPIECDYGNSKFGHDAQKGKTMMARSYRILSFRPLTGIGVLAKNAPALPTH